MWKKIILVGVVGVLWGVVGGFDWVFDSYECYNYVKPIVESTVVETTQVIAESTQVIAESTVDKVPLLTEEEIWKILDSTNLDGDGTQEIDIDEATYLKNKELFDKVEEEYNRVTDELNAKRK